VIASVALALKNLNILVPMQMGGGTRCTSVSLWSLCATAN